MKKMHLKTTITFRERAIKGVCRSHASLDSARVLQRHVKFALADNIKGMY